MDPNPTAEGKSVTPATDPAPDAPQSLSGWFRQNGVQLAIVAAIIVVVCRYLLDWSVDDTATSLDIPVGTVKSRLARALDQLARHLEDAR